MAERRMFAKSVINSARFLRMPPTSRLPYYDLGMAADDDGVVEAFTVLRTTGAAEDDLRVLATKGFVRVRNEDLVSLICDWSTNNMIRKDRYTPSIYGGLLVKIEDGNQLETDGQPMVNQWSTQVSIGKVSTGKESNGGAAEPPAPASLPETNFSPELQAAFENWLSYKKERREAYKATGLRALIGQIRNNAAQYGDDAVIRQMETAMASGWKGIAFDRLRQGKPQTSPPGKSWAELAREMEGGG